MTKRKHDSATVNRLSDAYQKVSDNGDGAQIATAEDYLGWREGYDGAAPATPQVLPDSGLTFMLRRVDRHAHAVMGSLPPAFFVTAVKGMKDAGLLPETDAEKFAKRFGAEAAAEAEAEAHFEQNPDDRDDFLREMAETVYRACDAPKLGYGPGLLDPRKLSKGDINFIYHYAIGIEGKHMIAAEGGEVPKPSLDKFRKRPARAPRTRADAKGHGGEGVEATGDNG